MTMTSACSVMALSCSGDREWRDPGAGGAAQLGVADDEAEIAQPGRGRLGQPQVRQHDEAVPEVERLGDVERLVRVLRRDRPVAPGVANGERDAVLGKRA